jgi:hypothetical protein
MLHRKRIRPHAPQIPGEGETAGLGESAGENALRRFRVEAREQYCTVWASQMSLCLGKPSPERTAMSSPNQTPLRGSFSCCLLY